MSARMVSAELTASAKSYLKQIEGHAINLDFVLRQAMQNSSGFRAIASEKYLEKSSELDAKIALDPYLSVFGAYSKDGAEASSPYAPRDLTIKSGGVSIRKKFSTGTEVGAELSHGNNGYDLIDSSSGSATAFNNFESKAKVTLAQNLWQDFLGHATRGNLKAGSLQAKAKREEIMFKLESWAEGLTGLFYQAWLAQKNVLAAKASRDRKLRLLKVTQLKSKRGTAEEQDLIQTQGLVLASESALSDAQKQLAALWKALVISLGLKAEFLSLNPEDIPITIVDPSKEALSACHDKQSMEKALGTYSSVSQSQFLSQASQHTLQSATDAFRPKLALGLSLEGNGLDLSSRGNTFSEAVSFEHRSWGANLTLSMPLGSYKESAAYGRAMNQNIASSYNAVSIYEENKIEWLNACDSLERSLSLSRQYEKFLKQQLRRVKLEEKRFNVGRTQLLNVIQAGDDATSTEIKSYSLTKEVHVNAWISKRFLGGYRKLIEQFEEGLNTKQAAIKSADDNQIPIGN